MSRRRSDPDNPTDQVAFVLNHVPDWDAISTSSLVDLPIVSVRMSQHPDFANSRQHRSLVLIEVLLDLVHGGISRCSEDSRDFAAWTTLASLHVEQLTPGKVAKKLNVSVRTVNRNAQRGFQLLAADLWRACNEFRNSQS